MAEVDLRFVAEESAVQMLAGGIAVKPNRQGVLAALKEAGYGEHRIDEVAITQALSKWPSDPEWITIGERRHAQAQVFFSKDLMSATLELTSGQGGHGVTVDLVAAAFRSHGVVFGILSEAVNDLIARAQALRGGHALSAIAAEGLPPVHGEDSRFEPLVATLSDRILAPRNTESGKVDFHDFGEMPHVEANVPIMRRHPPTSGEAGKNVKGEELPAIAGKLLEFSQNGGCAPSPSEPDVLLSTHAGLPVTKLRGMWVEDVYVVNEVNLSTGNVNFAGNVNVQKDVVRNMSVDANGTLCIGGFVDSARVQSSGDMVVGKGLTGGFAGNLDELITQAHCGANLWAQFAQFSRVETAGHFIAEKFLLHCRSLAGGAVRVGPELSGKGKLVGGETVANAWVKTDYLGDENEVRTIIIVNPQAMQRKQEINALEEQTDEKLRAMRGLKAILDRPNVKADANLRSRILATYQDGMAQMADMEKQRQQMLAEWAAQMSLCVVVVTRQLFPGVEVTIADKTWKANRVYGPGTIRYASDGLVFVSGEVKVPAINK